MKESMPGKMIHNQSKVPERYQLHLVLLGSFLLPVLIYFVVLMCLGFYPNGTKTVLFMDLKGEYVEYLVSLRHSLNRDNTVFFSWSHSLGGDMLGLYAFYSGGFLALFSFLFPISQIYKAAMLIELIAVGLCGISLAVFFEWGFLEKKGKPWVIAFSVCYALMSYNMVYSNCFFWLNGCIFLPLICLGIEQIFQGKKGGLFFGMLLFSMISNYYTAYMICIFSIIYFIFRAIGLYQNNGREMLSAAGKYILMAILSALSASPVLFGVVKTLQNGKLTANTDWTNQAFYYDFPAVLVKLFSGIYDSISTDHILPSVFCGMFTLFFMILYFVQRDRKGREKFAAAAVLLILILSFWIVKLDKVWHGFQQPHWFPWRYAFVFSFFVIFLAFQGFRQISFSKEQMEWNAGIVLLVFCTIDMAYNASVCIKGLGNQFGYMEVSEYTDFLEKTQPLVEQVKEEDDDLFRMDKDFEFSKNDSFLLGYNGMTHYSSTYNANVNRVTPQLGLAQSWYWNSGYGATPLVDSIFGVRYRMAVHAVSEHYQAMGSSEDISLYKNPTALSFAFAADEGCTELEELTGNVFENQNQLLSALTGEQKEYFTPNEFTREYVDDGSDLTFQAQDNHPVYLFIKPTGGSWGDISVNDVFVDNYFSTEKTCVLYLGTFLAGESVKVGVRSTSGASFDEAFLYSYDAESAREDLHRLKESELQLASHGSGKLTGTITVKDHQKVATSIPYEEGFVVMVDGKRISCEKILDTFLAFSVEPGTHEVKIQFMSQGFQTGIPAAGIAIGIFVIYQVGLENIAARIRRKKKRSQVQ